MKLKHFLTFALALIIGVFSFSVISANSTAVYKIPPRVEFLKSLDCPSSDILKVQAFNTQTEPVTAETSSNTVQPFRTILPTSNINIANQHFALDYGESPKLWSKNNHLTDFYTPNRRISFYKLE